MLLFWSSALAQSIQPDPVLGTRSVSFYGFFVIVGLLGFALTLTFWRNSERR